MGPSPSPLPKKLSLRARGWAVVFAMERGLAIPGTQTPLPNGHKPERRYGRPTPRPNLHKTITIVDDQGIVNCRSTRHNNLGSAPPEYYCSGVGGGVVEHHPPARNGPQGPNRAASGRLFGAGSGRPGSVSP